MIDSYANYKAYFQWIATNHVGLNSFHVGGVEDILGSERADMAYPCLWLEYPTARPDFASGRIEYTGAFVVMASQEVNDTAIQQTLEDLEAIVFDILGKINEDWQERQGWIDPASLVYDPILHQTSDNNYGWRVEFRSTAPKPLCYTPSQFGIEP